MGIIGAWRYRRRVLHLIDGMVATLGPSKSKLILAVGFSGGAWKKMLNFMYEDGLPETEAATSALMVSLRYMVAAVAPDQRSIALYAIKTGNRSDATANHLLSILDGIRRVGPEAVFRGALHETIGALEGRSGEELDSYRSARLLDDALNKIHQ